ncbi:ribosomal protein L7/L12 [Ornithinimicrobium flavum]|uniref:ribosomal protein L7/L12 n=1 Tax=Ornithinimicrobium flavum TaxID=1288636 RepID=UPI0010701988|nr:ribosomal protein L7/L12 [Ornithinimicrobium flavum]
MFERAQRLQQRVDHLTHEVRALQDLTSRLADRAGVDAAELERMRADSRPGITPEVRDLVARGQHIAAIKAYRQQTGAGLKEAKDAVEAYAAGR